MYMDPPSRTQIKASHLELENSRTPSEPMDTRCPYGLILDPRQVSRAHTSGDWIYLVFAATFYKEDIFVTSCSHAISEKGSTLKAGL